METTLEDLRKRYRELNDDQILQLYEEGEFTEIASSALKEELLRRGLTGESIREIKEERKQERIKEFQNSRPPNVPKIWIGFLFSGAFLIAEISGMAPISVAIGIGGMLYWLFCVQRFHQILDALTIDGYKISPAKAVGFHFIPVFNLYWVFKWPIELESFVSGLGKVKMIPGLVLGLLLFSSIMLFRLDGSIGLACIFGIGIYISTKLRKQTAKEITPVKEKVSNGENISLRQGNSMATDRRGKRTMSDWQRRILWITSAILLLMLLFPPFEMPRSGFNAGYGCIASPPDRIAKVNVTALFIQCVIIAGIGAICWFACKDRQASLKGDEKEKDKA